MALNEAQLKSDLLALYASGSVDDGLTDDEFATAMVGAFSSFIQSGAVLVTGVQPGGGTAPGTIS